MADGNRDILNYFGARAEEMKRESLKKVAMVKLVDRIRELFPGKPGELLLDALSEISALRADVDTINQLHMREKYTKNV